jgi:hypothetical protein
MQDPIENTVDTQKEWVAPELKKIDLDEITAGAGLEGEWDGTGWS